MLKFGASASCSLGISIQNTTENPVLLDVQQLLPSGTSVIDPGGATIGTNQLFWELNLEPGESDFVQASFILPTQNYLLSNTVAFAYDEVNSDWLQFEATPSVIQIAQSPPAQLQPMGVSAQGFDMLLETFAPGVYQVQATSNFMVWSAIATYTNTPTTTNLLVPGGLTNANQFYRAVQIQ